MAYQSRDFSDCDFAVLGGWIGTKIQSKLTHETVEKLYLGLMGILVLTTAFNVFKFIRYKQTPKQYSRIHLFYSEILIKMMFC